LKNRLVLVTVVALVGATWACGQMGWSCAASQAQWPVRYAYPAVVFGDAMWVLGGRDGMNDVWCSTDGDSWWCVNPAAPWSARGAHAAEAFAGRLWVLDIGDTLLNSSRSMSLGLRGHRGHSRPGRGGVKCAGRE